ncbi:hypothetical protein VE03_09874 [Pseudogymnoascus sp. 23342-1-I1]|nr:hypothetical protein VE03_09874 [Pseudogymnoascus sp. 23342-1-I1]
MPTFSDLPFEIRALIWRATVEPRTVEVRVLFWEARKLPHLTTATPVPAPLQTCREARNLGLYKKTFSELESAACDGGGAERRYVWVNLEIDVVSIGPTDFFRFAAVAPSVRRLKFEREVGLSFYAWEIDDLCGFVNVEEVYIVCTDGMEMWHGTTEDYSWPCGPENLIFIDPFNGRVMSAFDMEKVFGEERERRYAEVRRRAFIAPDMERVLGEE